MTTALIYKSNWTPSKPWCADLTFENGNYWKGWCSGFKSLAALKLHIETVSARVKQERRPDMDTVK